MRGSLALLGRHALVYGLHAVGAILLARSLGAAGFGAWTVLAFGAAVGAALVGLGLVDALVRLPAGPAADDERDVVRVQLGAALALAVVVALLAPEGARRLGLGTEAAAAARLVGASFLAVPLATVRLARLQRQLSFVPVAAADLAHAAVLNGLAVLVALRGGGLAAIALAFPAAAAARVIALRLVSPGGTPGPGPAAGLRPLLAFGVTHQAAALAAAVKDALTPVFLGLVAGAAAVGQVSWAQMVAAAPVLALMPLQRVYLPAFARLQDDRTALGAFTDEVVFAANAIVAPLAALLVVFAAPLTVLVFGPSWLPALPLLRLLWCANLLVATATPLLALLAAVGRPRVPLAFGLLWMALTWALGVPLILRWGVLGYGLANVLVQLTNLELFRRAAQVAPLHLLRSAGPPWGLAFGAAGAALAAAPFVPPAAATPVALVVGGIVYAALLRLVFGERIAALRRALR